MSKPTYILSTGEITAGASKVYADLFNDVTSGHKVYISGIYIKPKSDVAVSGVVSPRFNFHLTANIGSSGQNVGYASTSATAASITPLDSKQPAIPTGLTARTQPGAGATPLARLLSVFAMSEETNADVTAQQYRNVLKQGAEIVLNPGEGLVIKQGTVASLNDYEIEIYFSVEEVS